MPEDERHSFPSSYVRVWDHAGKTGGQFKLSEHGGFSPKTAPKDIFDNGASIVNGGVYYTKYISGQSKFAEFSLQSMRSATQFLIAPLSSMDWWMFLRECCARYLDPSE